MFIFGCYGLKILGNSLPPQGGKVQNNLFPLRKSKVFLLRFKGCF